LFSVFLSKCDKVSLAKIQSSQEVVSSVFFFSFLFFSFLPSKSSKSQPISCVSQVVSCYGCLSRIESQLSFSFHKNLRGIVRQAEVGKSANSVVTESSSRVTKRTVRQRFSLQTVAMSFFSTNAANDRGYGHWRFAGEFAVVKRQSEMRAQNPLNAFQPANAHRRVLGARLFLVNRLVMLLNWFL
jgi:hypothetical protein